MKKYKIFYIVNLFIGICIILFQIGFVIYSYDDIDFIYAHRNIRGEVDRIGQPWELWLFVLISMGLFALLQWTGVFFKKTGITERASIFSSVGSLVILVTFTLIIFDSLPKYHSGDFPPFFTPLAFIVISFLPLLFLFRKKT